MASKNLKIIYKNILEASTTSITASSTASDKTPVSNLKLDSKSKVWRSGSVTSNPVNSQYVAKANLVVTCASSIIGGVILPFCSLSSVATIRVRGYTGTVPTLSGNTDFPVVSAEGTLQFDTGVVLACPYQPLGVWNWGTLPLGVNSYSYGGGVYGRVWLSNQVSCTSLLIEIVDTNSATPYIEASKLVVGACWSPTYNTSYGLSVSNNDLSVHSRSESGDLITTRGINFRTISFDLSWLTAEDRVEMSLILRGNGLSKPIFISLFPDNSEDWEKEQAYQVYGKLSELGGLQHPVYSMYSTSINIEEI